MVFNDSFTKVCYVTLQPKFFPHVSWALSSEADSLDLVYNLFFKVDDHTLHGLGLQLEFHLTTYTSRWTIILHGFGLKTGVPAAKTKTKHDNKNGCNHIITL
jgi:hypothetical protein